MLILGLGGSIHDFSACLLHNGKIVCAIEEERLSRSKQAFVDASTFRCKAARYCLDYAGVTEKKSILSSARTISKAGITPGMSRESG